MRIIVLGPYVGNTFGTERATSDSCRLLRERGHQVGIVVDEIRGEAPAHDGLKQIAGLGRIPTFPSRAQVKALVPPALDFMAAFRTDVVLVTEHLHPALLEPVIERFPTAYINHSVAASCPAGHRLRNGNRPCTRVSGWRCLEHDLSYHCLPMPDPLRKSYAMIDFQKKRRALERAHRLIAVSGSLKETLVRDGWPADRIDVVYNAVETPAGIAPLPSVPEPLIVTTSRLNRLKGLTFLLEAMSLLRQHPWTLWMIGDGPERATLEREIHELALAERIFLLGKKSYAETQQVVRSARIFVQPNVGPEAFGIGYAEALAMGIPVVGSDLPAINELIRHEHNGLLVPPGDPPTLAAAIERLLTDTTLQKRLGQAAQREARERYSAETHVIGLEQALQRAMATARGLLSPHERQREQEEENIRHPAGNQRR